MVSVHVNYSLGHVLIPHSQPSVNGSFFLLSEAKSHKEGQAAFLEGAICIQDVYKSLYIYLETKAIKTPQDPPVNSETSL